MPSFLEGLANGISQGNQLNQQKQEKELKKKLIDLQAKQAQIQLDLTNRKQSVIDRLSREEPLSNDGTVATPMINAGQKPQSLSEKMAGLSVGDMVAMGLNPNDIIKNQERAKTRGLFEKLIPGFGEADQGTTGGYGQPTLKVGSDGGIDATFNPQKVSRTIQTTDQNGKPITLAIDEQGNVVRGFAAQPDIQLIDVQNADGSVSKVPVDLNAMNGQSGRRLPTKPSASELFESQPADNSTLNNTLNPETLERFPVGTLGKEIKNKGVYLDTNQMTRIQDTKTAVSQLSQLAEIGKRVWEKIPSDIAGRGAAAIDKYLNTYLQDDPSFIEYSRLSKSIAVGFARSLGEKGTLSEGDTKRALGLLANLDGIPDSPEVASQTFNNLFQIFDGNYKTVLGDKYKGNPINVDFTASAKQKTEIEQMMNEPTDLGDGLKMTIKER